jgi:ParB family chromosome partitioning protein
MDSLRLIPLTEIDPDALLRDRSGLDGDALLELTSSIATIGLRQPVEVWALSEPRAADGGEPGAGAIHRYGLISGLRRFRAFQTLAGGGRVAEFSAIPAFLRTPADIPAAMAAMVAENEVRLPVTPWDKGVLVVNAVAHGFFDTPDAAIAALFPGPSRQKRARIRSFAEVVDALGGRLTTPECLTVQRMERLAAALRSGLTDLIEDTLCDHAGKSLETQWEALKPVLMESLTDLESPEHAYPGEDAGRPRRKLHIPPGLTIRREITRTGWILRFSGEEARKGGLMDDVMEDIERWYTRP